MSKKLLLARIDTSSKDVVKRQYTIGNGVVEIDYVTKIVASQFNDEWREWVVESLEDGLTRLRSGPIIYTFRSQPMAESESRSKRPYYTEPADRFIALCAKIFRKYGQASDDVARALQDAMDITELSQEFDDTAVPFGIRVHRLEDGTVTLKVYIRSIEATETDLLDLAVGLRRILTVLKKVRKNYDILLAGVETMDYEEEEDES